MYEDKTLVCKECGQEFVFTAGEQEFYAERGFQNEPQRCKACRDARKNAARGPREYFTAVCAACGGEARAESSNAIWTPGGTGTISPAAPAAPATGTLSWPTSSSSLSWGFWRESPTSLR